MDYMLKKNYPLKINRPKASKSQCIKHNNFPKNRTFHKFKYTPSITNESSKGHRGGDLKKHKSTNKAISLNSLPNIDSFSLSSQNTTKNKGQFELFVRNKTAFFKNRDLNQEIIGDEQFGEIELLWDELGITDEYQDQFELYLGTINNPEDKRNFLSYEKNNLIKIKEALKKFAKEKIIRNNNIELLKRLNQLMKENTIFGVNKINTELLKEIIDCIKTLRINSVNVVNNLIKVREEMSCYSLEDKINFDKINDNFIFDNNYLLKMNSEMQFLKYSEIDKIFEKYGEQNLDTFLTSYINIKSKENEKFSISISKELNNAIDKCRYFMMQDSFLNSIKVKKLLKINNKTKQNNNKKVNSFMTLSNLGIKDLTNKYMDVKIHKLKNELGKNYNNIFLNSNICLDNNRKYNILKEKMKKNKNSNIIIKRDEEIPYKINEDININNKNIIENVKMNYEIEREEMDGEEKNILYNENLKENIKIEDDNESNNKKVSKYNEEEIIQGNDINNNDNSLKIDNEKQKVMIELKIKEENKKISKEVKEENKDEKEDDKKEAKKNKEDDEERIIGMNYNE